MLFVTGLLILGAGAVFLVIAGTTTVKRRRFLEKAHVVRGEVVKIVQRPDTEGTLMNYPVVEFETQEGRFVEFESSAGTSWTAYQVGQEVRVLYDPADPAKAIVQSFLSVWLPCIVAWALAACFCLVGGVLAACGGLLET